MPATMTPQQFVPKRHGVTLKVRSALQKQFIIQCQFVRHLTPQITQSAGE